MGTYVKKNGQLEEIAPVYTAGEGIEIQNNVVKAIPYTAGNNISIDENKKISCDISTMNFKGTVATYEQLPTDGQDVGDVWNISSTNTNYCWNGSNWITIGSSVDISGLMNKDGSNAAFPEHKGAIPDFSTMLINGGGGFKTRNILDIKSNFFPVDTILSKTSENPVQNKVITANMFVVFASETYDYNNHFILPAEIPIEKGVRIKFVQDKYEMLRNDPEDNFTINGRNVYVNKHGTPIIMPAHTVNNVELCVMQKYAAVEMVFLPELGTNGGWLVLGNPEVISYSSDTVSYTVKADGLIEQWGYITTDVDNYSIVGGRNGIGGYNGLVYDIPNSILPVDCTYLSSSDFSKVYLNDKDINGDKMTISIYSENSKKIEYSYNVSFKDMSEEYKDIFEDEE